MKRNKKIIPKILLSQDIKKVHKYLYKKYKLCEECGLSLKKEKRGNLGSYCLSCPKCKRVCKVVPSINPDLKYTDKTKYNSFIRFDEKGVHLHKNNED